MMFRPAFLRPALRTVVRGPTVAPRRPASDFAVSPQLLYNLEKRWETMPPAEQAEIWMSLRDRMVVDWKELSHAEKRAGKSSSRPFPNSGAHEVGTAHYISFGNHGPRTQAPPGEWKKVLWGTFLGCAAAYVLFMTRMLGAREPPKTMRTDWQEKSNEYLKEQRVEPLTGFAAEDYKGKGMVQTVPMGSKPGYNK